MSKRNKEKRYKNNGTCEQCHQKHTSVRSRTYMSGLGSGRVLCDACSSKQLDSNLKTLHAHYSRLHDVL
jgi:hypothetical protein